MSWVFSNRDVIAAMLKSEAYGNGMSHHTEGVLPNSLAGDCKQVRRFILQGDLQDHLNQLFKHFYEVAKAQPFT